MGGAQTDPTNQNKSIQGEDQEAQPVVPKKVGQKKVTRLVRFAVKNQLPSQEHHGDEGNQLSNYL